MDLEKLWHEYQSSLKAFLHSRVSSHEDAEDLLQEILIKVMQNLGKLEAENSVKAWLFQITSNTVIDYYRRKKVQTIDIDSKELPNKEKEYDAYEGLSDCVIPLIKALPTESAELLEAIDIKGISQKDYAETTGIKYSTLKSRVRKGRLQLKKLFEECCTFTEEQRGGISYYDIKSDSCKKC